jgi:hypothetical protein
MADDGKHPDDLEQAIAIAFSNHVGGGIMVVGQLMAGRLMRPTAARHVLRVLTSAVESGPGKTHEVDRVFMRLLALRGPPRRKAAAPRGLGRR